MIQNFESKESEALNTGNQQVNLDVSVIPVLNYALQQNNIPAVQCIAINNNSDSDLENIMLKIYSNTEILIPYSANIDFLPKNKNYEIKNIPVVLNAEFLAGITEKIKSRLIVDLSKDGKTIAQENVEITVLAFDEWHGYEYYPELLTSFVTPNHPALAKIIARAAELLKTWTDDPSMDAYQTQDPDRVLKQAAAIFTAIKEENIIYSVPPASFEKVGQRVRLCDAVLQQKLGTCLDLTLLYASCLEAIGLHPIMVLTRGHIFSGVWLDKLSFPESVQYDASVITKRLATGINELAVIETTLTVNGKNASFDDARAEAERVLVGTDPVECIIDVTRARISGISPLPQRVHTESGWHIEHDAIKDKNLTQPPKAIDGIVDISDSSADQNVPKLVQWERKLLDLGLRNNLINLRFSKSLIPILSSSLDDLEDALSSGNDFSILPKPTDWAMPSNELSFETTHELGQYKEVIKSEFENKRLRTVFTENELAQIIKDLYRTSKTALEENGANTLYLALGLLRWYENARSTKPRYAPVVLIPVEIIRKSAGKGFVIRLRDDEPQMNITILERIKQDFGITVTGVDPLPSDDYGVDLRKVFTILRKSIMEQTRWDVLESAYLGTFSFSQFVMWNDLRNRTDDLMKNKLVKSLADGKLAWEAKPMELGERVPEDNVLLPMPADASQLYAIKAACSGESFVLHGPPGTGKSQTITSLIANALAQGKTVLFVAEKMAALEVVQKRLDNIGIGPFCLELHSNKSKKKNVLEQLAHATEVTKYQTAEQYGIKAEQIAKLRSALDSYASKLHRIQPCGFTLHDLINEFEEYRNAPDIPAFSRDYVEGLNRAALEENIILLERLVAAARAVNHPHDHPLSTVGITVYTQQLRNDLQNKVNTYKNALIENSELIRDFSNAIGFSSIISFEDIKKSIKLAREMNLWYSFPRAWAKAENLTYYLSEVKEMANHYIKAGSLYNELSQKWNDMFFEQNGEQLLSEYNNISTKWFPAKFFGMRKLSKRLAMFSRQPIIKEEIAGALTMLYNYQTEFKAASELFAKYGGELGTLYIGNDTDWANIIALADSAKNSMDTLSDLANGDNLRIAFCGEASLQNVINKIIENCGSFLSAKRECYELLQIAEENSESDWLAEQVIACDRILSNSGQIKEWISFNGIAAEAVNSGLGNIVDVYKGGMAHDDILNAYKKSILYTLCVIAIDDDPALNAFSGSVFNEKIEQFKRMDKELTELSQKEIYCRLARRVPDFVAAAAQSSELGILQRTIKSRGRGTSIRKLFEAIPNLLPRLCPCMLMSPISAAQYLDPKRENFDIVVFDEASQLQTCKAVGVLARGKDAVIVGDPKQMPPTSFFATNSVDEEHFDVEDLESILDDCLALNMPQTHLLWHYRSRHESLISFSNNQFYENKLYTFPSVNDRESKVSLVHVDGVFERGKSRINRAEAEAVVEEIKRRCHDNKLCKESVGVVTFNISQQHLIDDLLTEACESDSELDKWVYESDEPVFIKNLENVQGDERDVILFSIGYGPDREGKVFMNFGPLNRDGGWRRLNVAVSRARNEMIVFAALRPDQINLSRTSSEGVAALKSFLEYAAGQEQAIDHNTSEQYRHNREGIVRTVCDALKAEGFDTDVSVGHSEYRIDIGVIDPQNPEKYILGILLDGACYGASKTTRDREIAQISILRGLGWNILRIWSMDWWDNRQKEIERIIAEIKNIQSGKQSTAEEPEIPENTNQTEILASGTVSVKPEVNGNPVEYVAVNLRNNDISADEFASGRYKKEIVQAVRTVIQGEAPISHSLLTRKVVQSFGIVRSGNRIQNYMDCIYDEASLPYTVQDGEKIYWRNDQTPESYTLIRVSREEDNKRDIKDVPLIEAVNAVCYVLNQQISLSEEDLIRESAKLMGYTRMGTVVSALFTNAINEAQKNGKIKKAANNNWILVQQ